LTAFLDEAYLDVTENKKEDEKVQLFIGSVPLFKKDVWDSVR